jgi:F-type H+-transporting ATPase subunit b
MNIILLADFSVIRPEPGMLVWTTIIFLLFWFILGKLAFKPIGEALKTRENSIQSALDEAKKAREEMEQLKSENDQILAQAREERTQLLKEAKETKDAIISEAKSKAKEDAQKIVSSAMNEIENQKKVALEEVKNMAGMMAIEIAEKVIRKELKGNSEQEAFVNSLVKEIKLN